MRSLPALLLLTCLGPASAQEVLLVDKSLRDPVAFDSFFEDFPEEGLELRYRRFHPTLVQSDPGRFDVIMVAGGTHPDPAATHLVPEEAALLVRFVRQGGTAVFLYAGHSTDNFIFNTILDSLDVAVRIEGRRIEDPLGPKATIVPATHYLNLPRVRVSPRTPLGEGIEGFIAGGRLVSLMVGRTEGLEIAAWTAPSSMRRLDVVDTPQRGREGTYAAEPRSYAAVVAAAAGRGRVILAPRSMINLNGFTGHGSDRPVRPPYFLEGNRRFERNLAGYIAAVARGRHIPSGLVPMHRVDDLGGGAGLPKPGFEFRKRTLDAEAGEGDYDDLAPFDEEGPHQPSFLGGRKVLSAHLSVPAGERAAEVCGRMKEMGLNLLYVWGLKMEKNPSGGPERIHPDSEALLEECGKAGLKILIWGYMPSTSLWLRNELATTLVDGTGKVYLPPSPLDPDAWDRGLTDKAREYALMARRFPETVAGTMWDLELYGHPGLRITEAHGFDNLSFATFVETAGERLREAGLLETANRVDQARRFGWLESHGLLRDYYRALEEGVYRLAVRTREAIDEVHPGLHWGLYAPNIPQSWYYRGLFRGLSRDDGAVLHITWQSRGARQVGYWKEVLGIDLIHAPAMLMVVPLGQEWDSYLEMCLENEAGYWLYDATSLVRDGGDWRARMELREAPGAVVERIRKVNEASGSRAP